MITSVSRPSPRLLAAAPHRLMFFIGAGNLLLAMGWWAAWLAAQRWPGLLQVPQAATYAGWLHAFVMQFQVLPSFFFGFLLTVFPRWMGLPDIARWRYAPVGVGLFGGQLAMLLGALGLEVALVVGVLMTLAGWGAGVWILGRLLLAERGRTWHARSCFAAMLLGLVGVACFGGFLATGSPWWVFFAIKLGTFGLLLPVYLTVAHRMFPFFAGNAVPGYVAWRPMWLLAAIWALAMAQLALELLHAYAWLWLVDVPMLALSLFVLWRWWPRGNAPGLLSVLFVGLLWWPLTFALFSLQSLAYLATDVFVLGRAPAHALFIGLFGSVLVAMVSRVTQGHSGRPLAMNGLAWFAFVGIQAVAALRIAAELMPDVLLWQALAALGWLLVLSPWVLRIGLIYLSPRVDGKPG
ncbi:NnrS family protein [Luteimonas viscosa]|uniref:NnrS family protein n=1 Tax=Luteimonas viscosa TaxID=1132694 RepID=A0A5D4XK73_9GAMM|nr:NnrS family protein [Luteimonas viscosa]TYT25056.1 NnrS family protein [Luteimonas viscosa]